jgi:hypothetical protein
MKAAGAQSCRESRCFAVWGHSGLNVLLLVGIAASLIGATLAFVSLDLNDLRFAPDHKGEQYFINCISDTTVLPEGATNPLWTVGTV